MPEGTDLQGEGFQLLKRQGLVGKPHDTVGDPGVAHLSEQVRGQGPAQIDPPDLGPEPRRLRRDSQVGGRG